MVADASFKIGKTLVAAAITKYEGQISTWKRKNKSLPCFRCLFPNKQKVMNIKTALVLELLVVWEGFRTTSN